MKHLFTSESVTIGHPDKICDTIADAILDEALRQDENSKMAVECTIKDDFVLIYGEANTQAEIDFESIAKKTLKYIGYEETFTVVVKVSQQSAEINHAVTQNEADLGAGDQGIMFGYASDETSNYMPLAIDLAHRLAAQLELVRRQDLNSPLRPDGKTQVTIEYDNDVPKRVDTVVVSSQHCATISQEALSELIISQVITPIIPVALIDENTKYLINPSGSFVVGGSFGDSGTTGRKIVVDTYGGMGRIGGGCFSSKDPSKVDRSAAYYCRYVAKNIVAAKLASRLEIQLSYAIGKSQPISIMIDTFNTGAKSDEAILAIIKENFDFSVSNIIKELDLKKPIYQPLAAYGHFGREGYPWERIKALKF